MYAPIVITDLTRMQGDHICVAGYMRNGTCVRPRFAHAPLTESWVWLKNQVVIRPFAEVELELHEPTPHPPHSEDYIVNPAYYRLCRHLKENDRLALLRKVEDADVASIFGAKIQVNDGWFVMSGQGTRSLGTVKASVEKVSYALRQNSRWDYRIAFKDGSGGLYRLAVTDLAFRCFIEYERQKLGKTPDSISAEMLGILRERDVYLRIGLARGWEKYPDRCHLQITGVHTFPDYLGGKCFADYALAPRRAVELEVPF